MKTGPENKFAMLLEARLDTEGLLFCLLFLLIIIGLLWAGKEIMGPAWKNIEERKAEYNRKQREKQAELIRPAIEKRKQFAREEILPFYKEAFKQAPIGYWCDPRDAYSRVVTYEDWEFREDGTGDFIFFTIGTGENKYAFRWVSLGEYHVQMKAEGEEGLMRKEMELKYSFEIRDMSIYLVREGYTHEEKPEIGTIGPLELSGGPVYEKRKQVFPGY